ncbi:hypothetical protein QM012_004583 [Aureobasidium pullulans]|uniref:F-box domain-containing protein n=1 Tax=Aureobasidium pullulans TaxID=5580 RepID=A0ABR0TTI7_AURPU
MTHILPEVLRTLFTLIREQQGLRVLTHLASVCKAWRDVAQSVLWTHVVLNNDTLENFIKSSESVTDKLKAVRSVTLHIEIITLALPRPEYDIETLESYRSHGSPKTQTLQRNIGQFSCLISPKLTSLESFSLFVDEPPTTAGGHRVNPDDDGFWLEPEVLGSLLRSLPASCTSLELDTSGTDWSPKRGSHHLCPDIWYMLPSLRHVKLRIHSLCSRIFLRNSEHPDDRRNEPSLDEFLPTEAGDLIQADHLATLSICILPRMNAGCGFTSCPELQASLDRGVQPWLVSGGGGLDTRPLPLTSNLVSAHKRGCFPAALKLEVVQEQWSFSSDMEEFEEDRLGMTEQEEQRAELYGHTILIRDCIEDQTYPMPLRYITSGMYGLYDKSDHCFVGSESDLIRHAENTVWQETVYGARMPLGIQMACAGAIPKLPPKLLTRKEWRQQSKKGMLSWRKEEGRSGVKIRRVIPLKGVDVEFDHSLMPLLPGRGEPVPGDNRMS